MLITCPCCGRCVKPLLFFDTTEEGYRELGWGADPETVPWFLVSAECPECGDDLWDKVQEWLKMEITNIDIELHEGFRKLWEGYEDESK